MIIKDYYKRGKALFDKGLYNKAFIKLTKGTYINDPNCMLLLSKMYENGLGVEINLNKSIELYNNANNINWFNVNYLLKAFGDYNNFDKYEKNVREIIKYNRIFENSIRFDCNLFCEYLKHVFKYCIIDEYKMCFKWCILYEMVAYFGPCDTGIKLAAKVLLKNEINKYFISNSSSKKNYLINTSYYMILKSNLNTIIKKIEILTRIINENDSFWNYKIAIDESNPQSLRCFIYFYNDIKDIRIKPTRCYLCDKEHKDNYISIFKKDKSLICFDNVLREFNEN